MLVMNVTATVCEIIPERREVEAVCPDGYTYKVRVPWYKIQDGFFKRGDSIPLKVVEQDQFALYDFIP